MGHQSLMVCLQEKGKTLGLPGLVVTFQPHPVEVLYPERKFERLFHVSDQEEQVGHYSGLSLKFLQFNQSFSRQSPIEFLEYLKQQFRPQVLVVGHDFTFGHKKSGGHELLKSYCASQDIELVIMPAVKVGGHIVSSSKIRDGLKLGDVELANQMLAREFYLEGCVVQGKQLGRTLGIPTANLKLKSPFVPRKGVYFGRVVLQNPQRQELGPLYSLTNVGLNPTVSQDESIKVETHILNFDSNLYGETLRVKLLHFVRAEKKFNSLDELKDQIALDIAEARRRINEQGKMR